MQQAYKPAMAISPAMDLLVQTGHTVVLWSPEKLGLYHKQVGINLVEARHFVVLTDQTFHCRDESEMIFQADLNAPRGIVQQTKTAQACAIELIGQYGDRGVVILNSLLDAPMAKVEALENKLAQLGWFEKDSLTELFPILDAVKPSDDLEETAIGTLREATASAIKFRESYLADAKGEMLRAREGKMGRANLTQQEVAYAREAGFDIDDNATTINQPAPTSNNDIERLAAMFAENNKAIVDTFATAMNNILAQSQVKGGQTDGNEKESGTSKAGVQRKA